MLTASMPGADASLALYLARREIALDLLAWWGDRVRTKPVGRAYVQRTWPAFALAIAGDYVAAGTPRPAPRDRTPLRLP